MKKLAVLLLCLLALPAHADPISIFVAISPILGSTLGALVASGLAFVAANFAYIAIGYQVFQSYRASRAAKKKAREMRDAYNNSLTDRMVTAVNAQPPMRIVYGDGLYGGDVVAIFTSDLVTEDGSVKTDGQKHLVVVCAGHSVEEIDDIRISGEFCGLSGMMQGWAQTSAFYEGYRRTKTAKAAGNLRSVFLTPFLGGRWNVGYAPPSVISVEVTKPGQNTKIVPAGSGGWTMIDDRNVAVPNTVDGVVIDATYEWCVTYVHDGQKPSRVYVSKFLGDDDQLANAYLKSKVPGKWTDSDRLRGLAGAVISLDLTDSRFQGGVPEILFKMKGRNKIYDPRTDTYGYTKNPALIVDDWFRNYWGYGVVPDVSATIAAANQCDEATAFVSYSYAADGSGSLTPTTFTGPRFQAAGSFTTEDDKEQVLSQLLSSMGGKVIHSADWRILAGTWTEPVRTLNDGDEIGPIQVLQAGEPIDELYNGIRGKYIPSGDAAEAEINPPYQNSTFVSADGEELWENVTFPFTDNAARAINLARILVETNRNGLIVSYPAKLKHWDLEVGQRVLVNNTEYGWTNKAFMILNWEFTIAGAVQLTMQEDSASAYDTIDAAIVDPTPNTSLPSPSFIEPPVVTYAAAGTNELILRADGSIVPRLKVEWDPSPSAYLEGGYYELSWNVPRLNPDGWTVLTTNAVDTERYIEGVTEGTMVVVRLEAVSALGARSDPAFAFAYIAGKSAAPAAVTGLAAVQVGTSVRITRTPTTELDWDYTVYEYSTNGGVSYSQIPAVSDRNGAVWNGAVTGALKIRARDVDTSGNVGSYSAAIDITVAAVGQVAKTYRVGAVGLAAWYATPQRFQIASALYDADDGALLVGTGSMYRVAKIHRMTRVVTDLGDFDTLGATPVAEAAAMAAALNSIDSQHLCVVFSWDEPQNNRLLGGLPEAMYRNGASRAKFGSPAFQYRGAYLLVGIGGCGEGNGVEMYAGDIANDEDAWCELSFQLTTTGAFVASGATGGPRTVYDIGYLGSNDATTNNTYSQATDPVVSPGSPGEGAIWKNTSNGRTYLRKFGVWVEQVGPSSVGTDQLAQGAAASLGTAKRSNVTVFQQTSGGAAGFGPIPVTLSVTNTLSRTVTIEATASATLTLTVAANGLGTFSPATGLSSSLVLSQYDGSGAFVASHGDQYADPIAPVGSGQTVSAYKGSFKRVDLPPGHRLDGSLQGSANINSGTDATFSMRDATLNFTEIRA